jgi:FtsP/CotA-like multicopper oxidase with cupredoxin domain
MSGPDRTPTVSRRDLLKAGAGLGVLGAVGSAEIAVGPSPTFSALVPHR